MNNIFPFLIALSLCGCVANKPKKASHGEVAAISMDRHDVIIVPQAPYKEKFHVMPVEYRALVACSPVDIAGRRPSDDVSFSNKVTLNNHEKWLSKMRAHATEMENQANGVIKSGGFDIKNIPIGVSYKVELDKPRKKAKKL